ncbi:class F sortase [Leifsonia shinshuensis]|uniref:Class F sortase n=1 Tax=Leifsonia shinshuensis TaxID=150026 RepID=A0A7G6YH13_9MICO|nr:class F sortase [Leifsonia shinshuensis]
MAIAGVLCAVAIVAGALTVSSYLGGDQPRDMRGNPVDLPAPSEAVRRRTEAVAQVHGMTLRVPSAGLAVPLGELNEVDGVIDPPGFSSAYLVRNYGAQLAHAGSGTVFVVMHSCRGGAVCPGNFLTDLTAGTASVRVGADVFVGGLHYRVTGSETVHKPDVHADAALWANAPGRLVLLTCLQTPAQTASVANLVISAQLVTTAG